MHWCAGPARKSAKPADWPPSPWADCGGSSGSASWICRWIPWAIEMAVGVPVAAEGLLSVDPRVVLWASDHLRRYKFLALRPPRACVYGHYVLHTWTRNQIHYEILWCIRPSDATKSTQSLSTTGILDLCYLRRYTARSFRSVRGPSRDRDRKDPQGCDWR